MQAESTGQPPTRPRSVRAMMEYEAQPMRFCDQRVAEQPTVEWWSPIVEYPAYEISSFGRIRRLTDQGGRGSYRAGLFKKATPNQDGYLQVWLHNATGKRFLCVHKLVTQTFVGPIPDGHVVNHRDGVPGNNRATNMEITTKLQDRLHTLLRHYGSPVGEACHKAILTSEAVVRMRRRYAELPASWPNIRRFKALGLEFGVHHTTARLAVNRKTWKHVA